MEAIWKMEDKWKLTTQEAILLFVCTATLVVGLCTATVLKKKRSSSSSTTSSRKQQQQQQQQQQEVNQEEQPIGVVGESISCTKWFEPRYGWGSVKRVLMGSVRWSGPSRKERRPPPLLGAKGCEGDEYIGWQSHNSVSPVWQRPILMGEKCELPRFSGLILYDERGMPLDHPNKEAAYEEKPPGAVRITLRDLL